MYKVEQCLLLKEFKLLLDNPPSGYELHSWSETTENFTVVYKKSKKADIATKGILGVL